MIISIVNEKGGSGKSTVCVNLATRLGLDGFNILVIDADPSKNIEIFSSIRESLDKKALFDLSIRSGSGLIDRIKESDQKYDWLIIDTGGRDSNELRRALLISDVALIPVLPSQFDLVMLTKMFEIIEEARGVNEELKVIVLLNQVSPNPFLKDRIREVKDFIKEAISKRELKGIILLENVLYERDAYRRSIQEGMGISEYKEVKNKSFENAYIDIERFYKEFILKIQGV